MSDEARPALDEEGKPIPPPRLVELETDAPTLASAYGVEHLLADRHRELISLSRLPPWPSSPPPQFGHGLGQHLNDILGGGLAPGEMVAVGASSAGAGKTAWLMQLADGMALRTAAIAQRGETQWGQQLTPVFLASEMGAQALSWRSLARWTGLHANIFRGGKTQGRRREEDADAAFAAGQQALMGELGEARGFMRTLSPQVASRLAGEGAAALIGHLRKLVNAWKEALQKAHPDKSVVPIVLVDPIQRYQQGDDEISDLNALARELCAATLEDGWISLVSSDTNKSSARGYTDGRDDVEEGAGVFRGSYKLIHEVTAAIYLRKPPDYRQSDADKQQALRHVEVVLVKNRWGATSSPWPRYIWEGPTMRFYPQTRERSEQLAQSEASAAADEKMTRRAASKGENGQPDSFRRKDI